MQLDTIVNHPEIVPERFYGVDDGILDYIKGVGHAISNTAANWDVVLFLIVTVVIVFGSIIVFMCSIKKIFKFQSDMETKAREEIRKKKMLKHQHLIHTQKSIEHEAHEMDTQIAEQIKSEENYNTPIAAESSKKTIEPLRHVDDTVFDEWLEPPPPEPNDDQMVEIEIDYSEIDVPDTFNMWPEPPAPIA